MQYRKFGNTGFDISALGFGCMRLPEYQDAEGNWQVDQEKATEMLMKAYESGVNYFDTAPYYCHANSEIAVGKALAPIRDKVKISTKCPLGDVKTKEGYEEMLDKSLAKLGTDYVDYYHFWGIDKKTFDEKIIGMGIMEEALRMKAAGKIRHISFSFHDTPEALKYIIDNAPEMESVLLQYNLLDRANEDMIVYAAEKGLGVVVMGPVGGGRLAAPTELAQKLGNGNLNTYELALRFVLGNPGVSCALSGMQTADMVEKNAAVASLEVPMTEAQWREAGESMENLKKFSELYCTGCAYCQPCPKGIEIPKIFEAYTYYNVYGLKELAGKNYQNYIKGNEEHKPGATSADCINCGYCERKCPQHLKIRDLLKKVEPILQSL
ncbi:MAG: aldo/keto reductase [Ruminococcaceae bacterium]|nr:aldo/keto reductase [Oscillospiraceae bacterium]